MANQYIDLSAVIQVIGCVFNKPEILDDTDKYIVHEDDFIEDFHKIIFGSIYNIHATGSQVTLSAVVDYLANRPRYNAIFTQYKGIDYLTEASKVANLDTFNYYYQRLKKFSLLRAYDNFGLDVSFLYDINNVLDTKKRQKQEDWLDSASLVDITLAIDKQIDEIKSKYVEDDLGLGYQAGEGIVELIEDFEAHPEIGIPLYGSLINTVTRGARLRKFYLRSAATGVGKAIPNDTLIPTPTGFRKVGDINIGDKLIGRDGKPTTVIAKYPQGKKAIWKVYFADGRIAKCCKDHLWTYRYDSHRGFNYRTESLEELYRRTLTLKNGLKDSSNKGFRFHIPLTEMVEYPEQTYSIHPYVLGAILGDGSLRYAPSQKGLSFSSENDELPSIITSFLPGYAYHKNTGKNYSYTFKPLNNLTHNLWVEELFSQYPALWNLKSEEKFIPEEYLRGSIVQRFFLLEGLLDTDGSISNDGKGKVSFTTNSSKLRDNVIELCQSLGMLANYTVDSRPGKYTTGECYAVHIQCKKALKPALFRLSRKHKIAVEYANSDKREEYKDHLAITKIEQANELTEMTCFTVDNPEHLFLMNDYIVTHNTRSMIADACNFACNKIWHDQFGWIKNGTKEPTLFIATEQDKGEVQTMMLAFLSGVNEEHILNGQYWEGERDRVLEAAKIIKESPIWIEELPDFSLQDVENKIKKNIREHDVKYILFDYLQTSLKILEEISKKSGGVRLREDNILFMLSARLKDIANMESLFCQLLSSMRTIRTVRLPTRTSYEGQKVSRIDATWD